MNHVISASKIHHDQKRSFALRGALIAAIRVASLMLEQALPAPCPRSVHRPSFISVTVMKTIGILCRRVSIPVLQIGPGPTARAIIEDIGNWFGRPTVGAENFRPTKSHPDDRRAPSQTKSGSEPRIESSSSQDAHQ